MTWPRPAMYNPGSRKQLSQEVERDGESHLSDRET